MTRAEAIEQKAQRNARRQKIDDLMNDAIARVHDRQKTCSAGRDRSVFARELFTELCSVMPADVSILVDAGRGADSWSATVDVRLPWDDRPTTLFRDAVIS